MNNEQQTWILKPEHEVIPGERNGYRWVTLLAPGEDVRGTATTMNTYGFEKHFVPLNLSGLTRQVEEQIHKAFIRGYEYGLKTDGEPSEDPTFDYEKLKTTIAEQVVLLLLNQEGETKK